MSINNIKNDPMLPVGDRPFWEEKDSDDEEEPVKSIPESLVLLKSLKQSREKLLYHTFPKFSSKSRGNKVPEVSPPPHTFQVRGRCDLEIGPHVFPETTFYEVNYLSSQIPHPPPVQNPTSNPYWQSAMAYNSTYQYSNSVLSSSRPATSSTVPTSTANATSATASSKTTTAPTPASGTPTFGTPLVSSLAPVAAVNGDLIGKVNAAASTNPILSNLLQLAAAGNASQDQLKTLGLLIQSLANMPDIASSGPVPPNPIPQAPSTQATPNFSHYQRLPPPMTYASVPAKPFDIVIEFRESPGERWLFPRGTVSSEMIPNPTGTGLNPDVALTTCVSSDGKVSVSLSNQTSSDVSSDSRGLYTMTLRMKEAPSTLWDTVSRWIGGEQNNAANKKQIENMVQPKRLYLGLQISSGSLLTQLQASCGPSYSMKLLRQGPAPPTRAPRQRKPYADTRKSSATNTASTTSKDTVIVKKRASHSKASAPTPIQCISCKQTDVPLILGGRYCRPCVDTGRWDPLITPQANQVQATSTPANAATIDSAALPPS